MVCNLQKTHKSNGDISKINYSYIKKTKLDLMYIRARPPTSLRSETMRSLVFVLGAQLVQHFRPESSH